MAKLTYIYGLKDPRDEKFYYVGRTNNPTRRNYEHRSKLKHTYSPWHRKIHDEGVKPVMVVLEKTTGNGLCHELKWMKKLRSEGHPLANLSRHSLGKISEQKFGPLKTQEQIKKEQGERIRARWRKWWDSLTTEQKSEQQKKKLLNGGKEKMIAAQKGRVLDRELVERRAVLVKKALAKPSAKKKMSARTRNFWASMTKEERSAFAKRRFEKMSPESKLKFTQSQRSQ